MIFQSTKKTNLKHDTNPYQTSRGRHLLDKKIRVKSDLLVFNQIFGLFLGSFQLFWDLIGFFFIIW
jgi:hypothetical protein